MGLIVGASLHLFTGLPLLFGPSLYDIKVNFPSTTLHLDQWLAGLGLFDTAEFFLFNVVSCVLDMYYFFFFVGYPFLFFVGYPFPFVLRLTIGLSVRLMTLRLKFLNRRSFNPVLLLLHELVSTCIFLLFPYFVSPLCKHRLVLRPVFGLLDSIVVPLSFVVGPTESYSATRLAYACTNFFCFYPAFQSRPVGMFLCNVGHTGQVWFGNL